MARPGERQESALSVTLTTMACPYCGGVVPYDATICPDCQEDLAPLVRLQVLHAIYYNEGLAHARRGRLDLARDRLCASLAVNPSFMPSLWLITRVCAAAGDWTAARRYALQALDEAPRDPDVRRLLVQVEDGARAAAGARRPRPYERLVYYDNDAVDPEPEPEALATAVEAEEEPVEEPAARAPRPSLLGALRGLFRRRARSDA